MNYVFQFDYAQQTDAMDSPGAGGVGTGRLARWYGWNQYLFYKVSDCWTWGTRFDIWRDEEGYRMGGFLGNTNNGTSLRGLGTNYNSFAGTNYEIVGRCQLAAERQHGDSSCGSLGYVPGQPRLGYRPTVGQRHAGHRSSSRMTPVPTTGRS